MQVSLVSGDKNDFVTYIQLPPYQKLPGVIMWGSRVFVLEKEPNLMNLKYEEVLAVFVP